MKACESNHIGLKNDKFSIISKLAAGDADNSCIGMGMDMGMAPMQTGAVTGVEGYNMVHSEVCENLLTVLAAVIVC